MLFLLHVRPTQAGDVREYPRHIGHNVFVTTERHWTGRRKTLLIEHSRPRIDTIWCQGSGNKSYPGKEDFTNSQWMENVTDHS